MGVAVILAAAFFLVVRHERSPHRRQYVTIRYDSRAIHALVDMPKAEKKALMRSCGFIHRIIKV